MPQLTLTQQATPLQSQSGAAIVGQNLSRQYALYLSELPDVSPTINSTVIGPGGDFTWPGDKPIYACTDPGASITISYLNNGATINSGAVTANSANAPELLAIIGSKYGTNDTGLLNVGNFASIIVTTLWPGTGTPIVAGNFIHCQIDTYNSKLQDLTTLIGFSNAQYLTNDPSRLGLYQAPVIGPWIVVSGNINGTGTVWTMYVYGSNETIYNPRYAMTYNNGFGFGSQGGASVLQIPSGGNITQLLNGINGPAVCVSSLTSGTTLPQTVVYAYQTGSIYRLLNLSAINDPKPLILPARPIAIQGISPAGSTSDISIQQ